MQTDLHEHVAGQADPVLVDAGRIALDHALGAGIASAQTVAVDKEIKSYEKTKPPLGWPRETDSLCPKCVPEIRKKIVDGELDYEVLLNEKVGEIKAQIIERDGEIQTACQQTCPSQAIVFGDRKPYLTALLTPNIERLIDYSRAHQIDYIDVYELVKNSRITKLYDDRIDELNRKMPPYSTIKYFALVPKDFSISGGELTPTLKLKRKEIYNKYKAIVDEMYMSQENGVVFKNKAVVGETQ